MTPSNLVSFQPTQAVAQDRVAAALTVAFSCENPSDHFTTGAWDYPIDAGVLQIVPAPAQLDFDKLRDEVSRQRRIVVRGERGIPVAAVISIGGALFIHAMLIGGFLLSFYLAAYVPGGGGGAAAKVNDADMSGGAGYMFLGDGAQGEASVKGPIVPEPAVRTPPPSSTPPLPPAPAPPIPEKTPLIDSSTPQIAMNPLTSPPDNPEIGVPSGADVLGNVHPTKPRVPDVAPAAPVQVGLPIASPPQVPILATPLHANDAAVHSQVPAGGTSHAGSPRPGVNDGGGESDNDEGTISLLNSNAPGDGVGTGKHRGSGIDRGASGGDNETPSVLEAPAFKLWAEYQFHPPKRRVILTVTVLPDGRTGPIEIAQSCGIPDIDNTYKVHVAREYRFRPAYRDGKPFTATIECSQSFGTDDQ